MYSARAATDSQGRTNSIEAFLGSTKTNMSLMFSDEIVEKENCSRTPTYFSTLNLSQYESLLIEQEVLQNKILNSNKGEEVLKRLELDLASIGRQLERHPLVSNPNLYALKDIFKSIGGKIFKFDKVNTYTTEVYISGKVLKVVRKGSAFAFYLSNKRVYNINALPNRLK